MDPNPNMPVAKQRSPWLYVALGCGGFALALCLAGAIVVGTCGYKLGQVGEGMRDPGKATENALARIGSIPEGYFVYAGIDMFVMEMFIMGDLPMMPDGGVGNPDHVFSFFHIIGNDQNAKTKAFFTTDGSDDSGMRSAGINVEPQNVIKRGQLTVDGRKLLYVAYRGRISTGNQQGQAAREGLNTALLFDCPGDALNIGVWNQADPDPSVAPDQIPLSGTVADEAQVSRFVKNINPCH